MPWTTISSRVTCISLRIDKGSPGGALYLGTCIHNYDTYIFPYLMIYMLAIYRPIIIVIINSK